MEQVRAWYGGEDINGPFYRVEEQTMSYVSSNASGTRWSCDCGEKRCRHIAVAKAIAKARKA